MNIHQALSGIAQIRQQIDRAESYRGFRSATTVFSGVCAIVSGTLLIQTGFCELVFPQADETALFLAAWIAIACVSLLAACAEMFVRARRDESGLVWRMHRNVAFQIVPAFAVGVTMTWLLVSHNLMHVLPGIWAMVYGLALIASIEHLPTSSRWVAAYFIAGGIVAIAVPPGSIVGLHLQMMVLFGVGQSALGGVLHWNMERADRA